MKVFRCFSSYLAVLFVGILALPSNAAIIQFTGTFSGANEGVPNASPATGTFFGVLDDVARTLRLQATFSGLLGTVTQAHIHSPAVPGVNAPVAVGNTSLPSFPLAVSSGTYDQTIDLMQQSVYNTTYFAGNGNNTTDVSNAIMNSMKNNLTYFNIHTTSFAGGEIRANITAVPEPSSLGMLGVALVAASVGYRRLAKRRVA